MDEFRASTAWQKAEPRTVSATAMADVFFIRIFGRLIVMGLRGVVEFFQAWGRNTDDEAKKNVN